MKLNLQPTRARLRLTVSAIAMACASLSAGGCLASNSATNNFVLEAQTMDMQADPCQNFYQYANGNWLAQNPIPSDRSRYSAYDEITERNLSSLKQIAELARQSLPQAASMSVASRVVANFYASGMNEAAIEAAGIQALEPESVRINGLRNHTEILPLIANLQQQGLSPLFSFSIEQDAKNSSRVIPQLTQAGLSLPDRDYYLKNDAKHKDLRQQYLNYLQVMHGLIGESEAQARQHAKLILKIETELARASLSKLELRDPAASYHLYQSQQLKRDYPQLNWEGYFSALQTAAGTVPVDQALNLAQPKFFKAIAQLLPAYSVADWQVYLRWQVLNARAKDLSSAFVHTHFDFFGKTLAGTEQLQPRWKRVLQTIDSLTGEALGELYVAKHFTPEAKAGVLQMVEHIKQAMRASIAELPWMSEPTRQQAYRKIDSLLVKIGYPERWRDYSTLQLDQQHYLRNIVAASQLEFQRNLAKLGKPVDRQEWGMTPQTVNAYYNPTINEMVFPAGILQAPLYHVQADIAANYGNTGATIGHELIHAFDDEGRQYDAEGNLKNWWSKQDERQFLQRVKAIHQQFDEFKPIDNLHINGKLTAGENIADLGGMKIALRAMRQAIKQQAQAELIDGLTPEQRFFIANAQSFRSQIRDQALRLKLATDPHAPDKYRVLAPIANMPEFSQAFSCSAERSPLRPKEKRVMIW